MSKEVAGLKKACKKASSCDWGKRELANLSKCRDEPADLQMDCLESVKEKLLQSAAAFPRSSSKNPGPERRPRKLQSVLSLA